MERASREEVLAFFEAHPEVGNAEVADALNVPLRTVQRWRKQHRLREDRPRPSKKSGGRAGRAKRAPSARVPTADELAPDVREQIKQAIRERIDWLADPENIGAKGERDIAVTLGILADKWGDVLEAADAKKGKGQGVDLARLDQALGITPRDGGADDIG